MKSKIGLGQLCLGVNTTTMVRATTPVLGCHQVLLTIRLSACIIKEKYTPGYKLTLHLRPREEIRTTQAP